jgi:hypothetical protein
VIYLCAEILRLTPYLPSDPRYPSYEDFSDRDKANNDYDEKPGYLGTPSGVIKKYWPAPYPCERGSGAVEIIGTGAL